MSKRFQEALKQIDTAKTYSAEEAVKLAKQTSTVKFDASVEAHFHLNIDPKQTDQKVRTQISLPHGTGKILRVAAFVGPAKEKEAREAGADFAGGEEIVKEIKQSEKTDFDVAVADGSMMKSLASIAKILGQRGLMPNPKAGTVGEDIGKIIRELKSGGKIEIKTDDSGNIHTAIGKASFDAAMLAENFQALKEAIHRAKPASVKKEFVRSMTIATSMGPGIKIQ